MRNSIEVVKAIPLFSRTAICLAALFFLTGCGSNWLVGKWTIDKERTLAEISSEEDAESTDGGGGLLKDIVSGLQKGFSRVILAQFEGVEVEFTKTEMRRMQEGMGEAQEYEIIDQPDPSTYTVKYADGDIVTWRKSDTGIRLKLAGEKGQKGMWVYFRPVEE
ncbi:MAG: hypothetical protein MI807_11715 [Verrucomicrobiales bacterium]|nr:hypothetical protein [Verrucomicrobiales bacterium]